MSAEQGLAWTLILMIGTGSAVRDFVDYAKDRRVSDLVFGSWWVATTVIFSVRLGAEMVG